MNKTKRILALILSIILVFCSVNVAFAAPEPASEARIANNWFKSTTKNKSDITSITIEVNHVEEASASETWDASDTNPSFVGTVMCYLYDTDLVISIEEGDKIYPSGGTTTDNSGFTSLFSGFSNVQSIEGLDALVVQGCRLANMFQGCAELTELDLSGWTVDYNVNCAMNLMFADCTKLEHINFDGWTHIGSGYNGGDRTFRTIGLKELDFEAVGYMQYAWGFVAYAPELLSINIPNFSTSGWSDQVIFGNPKLTEITFGSGFASNLVSKPGYLQKPSATVWKHAGEKWYDENYNLVDSWADYPSGGTFYAMKYCDVSFNTASGSEVETQMVHREECACQPDDPTWGERTFEGWYTDKYYTEEFDFSAPILTDVVVYAKWSGEPTPVPPTPGPTPVKPDEGDVVIYNDLSESFTSTAVTNGSESNPISGEWKNNNGIWQFNTNSGLIKNGFAWIMYNGKSECFYFDKSGNMQVGWQLVDGVWYYFDTTSGVMLRNTTTPDNYKVDTEGKWVQ